MTSILRPSKTRVRAPRISIDLTVASKTIGTDANYSLSTLDISRSGLLLEWDRNVKVPFNVNTIIEMTIDPDSNWLGGPVSCLGKIVRRENVDNSTHAKFGVQIVQIDNSDLSVWENCVTELEKKFGLEVSKKVPMVENVA